MFQALFFEDFKAFGFFFSLLDPENIYLLALGILICGFYNAWCEEKVSRHDPKQRIQGPLGRWRL